MKNNTMAKLLALSLTLAFTQICFAPQNKTITHMGQIFTIATKGKMIPERFGKKGKLKALNGKCERDIKLAKRNGADSEEIWYDMAADFSGTPKIGVTEEADSISQNEITASN